MPVGRYIERFAGFLLEVRARTGRYSKIGIAVVEDCIQEGLWVATAGLEVLVVFSKLVVSSKLVVFYQLVNEGGTKRRRLWALRGSRVDTQPKLCGQSNRWGIYAVRTTPIGVYAMRHTDYILATWTTNRVILPLNSYGQGVSESNC